MPIDIKKYKQELTQLKGKYQRKIILPKPITFGTEIEFVNANLNTVEDVVRNEVGPINTGDYESWQVKTDDSATKKQEIIIGRHKCWGEEYIEKRIKRYGGEVVSRILQNDEQSWDELSRVVLNCLKIENFGFNDKCAFHVHFGKCIFKNPKFIQNLFKAYTVFEDILLRTSYGATNRRRPDLVHHATLSSYFIYNRLKDNFNNEEKVEEFLKEYAKEREQALNLSNYIYRWGAKKYTVEMRGANYLESRFLMQNTIRIFINFLLYCDSDEFDDEFFDYYLEKIYKPKTLDEYEEENFEKAMLFGQIFIKDDLDRLYFMKQYLKCYQESDIIERSQKKIQLINR